MKCCSNSGNKIVVNVSLDDQMLEREASFRCWLVYLYSAGVMNDEINDRRQKGKKRMCLCG